MADRETSFEGRGTAPYLAALREHWLLIVVLVVGALIAAVAYTKTATPRYEAEADVLVNPVGSGDATFLGFSLLRDSGSAQTSAVLTAARLVKTPEVASAVVARVPELKNPENALAHVSVTPLDQSSIVSIIGKSSKPAEAAAIANGFAQSLLAQRRQAFQSELAATIKRLRAQISAIPAEQRRASPEAYALQSRLGELSGLIGTSDPTLQLLSSAVTPTAAVWPRPVMTIAIALVAALVFGVGIALALELVSPRVNREEELLLAQRIPILARVPRMRKRVVSSYLSGREPLPGDVREAYRTLRTSLDGTGPGREFPRVILVTSAIPGEAKTMSSVNLAVTIAVSGQRVILVDGDLRRPMVATVFGVAAGRSGFESAVTRRVPLEESLIEAPGYGEKLRLLLSSPDDAHLVDAMKPERVAEVIEDLRELADVVVIDSPPLTEVADALVMAEEAEAIVVAVRLGHTRRDRLAELRRVLSRRGLSPTGFVVTSRRRSRGTSYYGSDAAQPSPDKQATLRGDGDRNAAPALLQQGDTGDF